MVPSKNNPNLVAQLAIGPSAEFPNQSIAAVKALLENFSLSEKIHWLKSSLSLESFEVCIFLLEEIERINNRENFKFKYQFLFIWENFQVNFAKFNSYFFPSVINLSILAGLVFLITGAIFFPEILLTLAVFGLVLAYVVAYFCFLDVSSPSLFTAFTFFMLPLLCSSAFVIVLLNTIMSSMISSVQFVLNKPMLSLIPNRNLLLTYCIDEYFEGKDVISSEKIRNLFKQCLNKKAQLTKKEMAFMLILQEKNQSFLTLSSQEIWQNGVKSWQHYRFLRQTADLVTQLVLNELLEKNQLFQGSTIAFTKNFNVADIENYTKDFEKVAEAIRQHQVLAKVIKPHHWSLFIKQLTDLRYRPPLRQFVVNATHKFVHLSGEVIRYVRKRNLNKDYTHTKKTSTTLLSTHLNTPLYKSDDVTANLVGFLFDETKCKIKARLIQDSGTYKHGWVNDKSKVEEYQKDIIQYNEINKDAFILKIQARDRTNEVLAQLNKEALLAIIIGRDTPEARNIAIARQIEIKNQFSMLLPIIFYDSEQKTIKLYEWKQILYDKLLEQKKQNLLKINQQCLIKTWQFGFFKTKFINHEKLPSSVAYLDEKIKQLQKSDKRYDYYSWLRLEQNLKDKLTQRCQQNWLFRMLNGRSRDTVEFYQSQLSYL